MLLRYTKTAILSLHSTESNDTYHIALTHHSFTDTVSGVLSVSLCQSLSPESDTVTVILSTHAG